MSDAQVISEVPINIYQLKKELDKIKKRDKELNFRANKTDEYLTQITSIKNSDELFEKVMKLNVPRLKEQHIHKIIDLAPVSIEELKVILQSYTITISNESMKKIVETVAEHISK